MCGRWPTIARMRILTRAAVTSVLMAGILCSGPLAAQALERGNGPEPSTLDPHRCPEVACANVLRDLYEGLVAEDGAGRLIPGMAERWQASAALVGVNLAQISPYAGNA